MDIAFKTRKLQRVFNSERELRKKYGERRAAAIMRRLAVLKNAPTLDKVPVTPPNRCHRLTGGRKGAVRGRSRRPVQARLRTGARVGEGGESGDPDQGGVTAVTIVEVVDYH